MKRIILMIIALMLLFPTTSIFADDDINVYIDGELLDANGLLVNGSTLVPLRSIFEALGATVDWDGETKTVTSTKDGTVIKLTIGNTQAFKNDTSINLSVPAQIINDSTYVPLRFVSESFGCDVQWDGVNRTVNITTRSDIAEANLKDDVIVFDNASSKEIESNLINVSYIENQTILHFKELPKQMEDLEIGDKFILSPTELNPLGYIGKIAGMEQVGSEHKIIVDEVFLEEIFKQIDIDIHSELNVNNLMEVQTPQYTYVNTNLNNSVYNTDNMLAAGPGFDLNEVFNNLVKEYNYENNHNKGDFIIGLNGETTIYDKDGNSFTTNDQLRLSGSVALDNMRLNAILKYDEIYDWEQFYVDFECDKSSELSLIGDLNRGISLNDIVDSGENTNVIDLGYVKVEGVDRSGTITLASLVFNAATLTVRPDVGDPTELPLAIIVSISIDLEGNINTSFSLEYNYREYMKKGINIQEKSLGKLSEYDYETDNYYIDAIDKYYEKKNEIVFDASGGAKVSMTAGSETMIMIGGIVPVDIKAHGGVKVDASAFDGNIKYDLLKPEGERLDYYINFGDIYAKAGIFASLDIRLQYEIWKVNGGFETNAEKEFIFWEYDSSKTDLMLSDLVTFYSYGYGDYYTGGVIKNVSDKTIKINTVTLLLYEDGSPINTTTPFIIPKVLKPGESASFAEPGKIGRSTKEPVISYEYVNNDEAIDVKIEDVRYNKSGDDLLIYADITTKENLTSDIFDIIFYNKDGEIINMIIIDEAYDFKANYTKEIVFSDKNTSYVNDIDRIDIFVRFKE